MQKVTRFFSHRNFVPMFNVAQYCLDTIFDARSLPTQKLHVIVKISRNRNDKNDKWFILPSFNNGYRKYSYTQWTIYDILNSRSFVRKKFLTCNKFLRDRWSGNISIFKTIVNLVVKLFFQWICKIFEGKNIFTLSFFLNVKVFLKETELIVSIMKVEASLK